MDIIQGVHKVGSAMEKAEEQITPKLKVLREILFEQIMGNEISEIDSGLSLRIAPKTLAEVIKALIDVDKRIGEREGIRSGATWDEYQRILANCANIAESDPEKIRGATDRFGVGRGLKVKSR
jgi:hypothetical protein